MSWPFEQVLTIRTRCPDEAVDSDAAVRRRMGRRRIVKKKGPVMIRNARVYVVSTNIVRSKWERSTYRDSLRQTERRTLA